MNPVSVISSLEVFINTRSYSLIAVSHTILSHGSEQTMDDPEQMTDNGISLPQSRTVTSGRGQSGRMNGVEHCQASRASAIGTTSQDWRASDDDADDFEERSSFRSSASCRMKRTRKKDCLHPAARDESGKRPQNISCGESVKKFSPKGKATGLGSCEQANSGELLRNGLSAGNSSNLPGVVWNAQQEKQVRADSSEGRGKLGSGANAAGSYTQVQSDNWIGWPSDSESDSDTAERFDAIASSLATGQIASKKYKNDGIIHNAAEIKEKEKNLLKQAVLESGDSGGNAAVGFNKRHTAEKNYRKNDECVIIHEDTVNVNAASSAGNGFSKSQASRVPPRRQSSDCMIVDSPQSPATNHFGHSLSAMDSTASSENQVERARNDFGSFDDGDDSLLCAIDLEADDAGQTSPVCTASAMDDSIQLLGYSDNDNFASFGEQNPSPGRLRQRGTAAPHSTFSPSLDFSMTDFIVDDEISSTSHPHEQTSGSFGASAFETPDVELVGFESPSRNDCVQVPGMPPMTDEEYARFLQHHDAVGGNQEIKGGLHPYHHLGRDEEDILLTVIMLMSPAYSVAAGLDDSLGPPHLYPDTSMSGDDSYEENLRLQEAIGDVKSKAMPRDLVLHLPTHTYTAAEAAASTKKECHICMCHYDEGETERVLPCFHTFHVKCIDKWFEMQATCPVCRESAMPGHNM
ncbi:hypothetical protein BaRGS_00008375 [Batillaria attramentaria]|uniref:RING-type E3 ubiquitin transferase n=1 Tax=Batillaria attramentaria TaxID=370345 RepID=A0ABD0LLX4_9CAEN